MARPNRVFFLCSEYNNLKSIAPINIPEFMEFVIQSLVSGFGPYPVISIEVIDNLATVTLNEEVTIHPGVKLDINGTGVSDLDGMQEIESIDGNTFTFKVTCPNGTYTNGVTYSYMPLGWSLLFRSTDSLVLSSGNSGTMQHCILLKFVIPSNSGGKIVYTVQKVKSPTSTVDFEEITPKYDEASFLTFNLFGATGGVIWYFYGDDAFVLQSFAGFNVSYMTSDIIKYSQVPNAFCFGELKKTTKNTGSFFTQGYNTYYNSASTLYFNATLLYDARDSNNASNSYRYWIFSQTNDSIRYYLPAITQCNGYYGLCSGTKNNNDYSQRLSNNVNYMSITVADTNNKIHGMVPGFYFLRSQPALVPLKNNLQMLYPLRVNGSLAARKCYAVLGTVSTNWNHIGSFDLEKISTCMLDLTGPIR